MYQMGKSSSSLSSAKPIKNNNKSILLSLGRQSQPCCKKHPKHKQSPGVCSLCLSDKLSKVPPTTSRSAMIRARARVYYHHSSSSSSSLSSTCDSSYASSAAASPVHDTAARHRRIVSDVRAMNVKEDNRVLFSKSKSMAHVGKDKLSEEKRTKKIKVNNNVGRFWSNLFRLGRNDQQRVNAEVIIDRKSYSSTSPPSSSSQQQPVPSSSTVAVY